jgi:hypothetical protein
MVEFKLNDVEYCALELQAAVGKLGQSLLSDGTHRVLTVELLFSKDLLIFVKRCNRKLIERAIGNYVIAGRCRWDAGLARSCLGVTGLQERMFQESKEVVVEKCSCYWVVGLE